MLALVGRLNARLDQKLAFWRALSRVSVSFHVLRVARVVAVLFLSEITNSDKMGIPGMGAYVALVAASVAQYPCTMF